MRAKEDFKPLNPKHVRMYVCGPTVYDLAHIGNARPVIVFDVLFRLLKHLYEPKGAKVTYVRNITDVDDKINARASEEGVSIGDLTERTTLQFHEDVAALGCLPPSVEPRATEHIREMKAMITKLVDKGFAYVAEDHVLFHVAAMPDYGQLARRSVEDMQAGARVEVAPYKRDPMDFVLWKPSKEGEPAWPSPCGIEIEGRPGWHLECSAMSAKHLGKTFDIHGGGIDLLFPHHENEVAQSRCAHGTEFMANVWMHNGHLMVEGEKMSKSLGNFVTINELLTGWKGFAWPGEAIRLNMLRTHYRQPFDWTFESLDESHKALWDWYGPLGGVEAAKALPGPVLEALSDDLNTPLAIAEMHRLHRDGNHAGLAAALHMLGFSGKREKVERRRVLHVETGEFGYSLSAEAGGAADQAEVEEMVAARLVARKAKNWAEADRIRDDLAAKGITLKDAKDPRTGEIVTTWEAAR
jgi:cysteinyl-tRNA synthetase